MGLVYQTVGKTTTSDALVKMSCAWDHQKFVKSKDTKMSKIEVDTKELIESLIDLQGVASTVSDLYDVIVDKLGKTLLGRTSFCIHVRKMLTSSSSIFGRL